MNAQFLDAEVRRLRMENERLEQELARAREQLQKFTQPPQTADKHLAGTLSLRRPQKT